MIDSRIWAVSAAPAGYCYHCSERCCCGSYGTHSERLLLGLAGPVRPEAHFVTISMGKVTSALRFESLLARTVSVTPSRRSAGLSVSSKRPSEL